MATLSTANSVFMLAVRGLFPVPQKIEGYAVDDSFAVDDVNSVEVAMGVDGKLSGGFVPTAKVITFQLQADSPSMAFFDTVIGNQDANKETLLFDGTGILQGTGEKFAMTKGFLTTYTPMSTAKKILQPRKFTLTFESVTKAPV